MSTATCAICVRIEEGGTVNAELLRQYKLGKGAHEDISMLLMPEVKPEDFKKFSMATAVGAMAQALGFAKEEKPVPRSKKIAEQKRRGRLFSNVDLGSMTQVDKELGSK